MKVQEPGVKVSSTRQNRYSIHQPLFSGSASLADGFQPRFQGAPDENSPSSAGVLKRFRAKLSGQNKAEQKPPRTPDEIEASRQAFLEETAITKALVDIDPQALKNQVYPDLRVSNWWFWKNQSDKLVSAMTAPLSKLSPERRERAMDWAKRKVEPAYVEQAIAESPFFNDMDRALKSFGDNPVITPEKLSAKIADIAAQVEKNPSPEKSEELTALKALEIFFPHLSKLANKPGTLTNNDIEAFKKRVQYTIPFLYTQFNQHPELYVQDSLYRIGAIEEPPTLEKGPFGRLNDQLNEYEGWRKFVRKRQKNQTSDFQFLPLFSFIGAAYGQFVLASAPKDLKVYQEFKWANVFRQMVQLDAVFEGIGFYYTRLQLLLVRRNEEKPDRVRSQFGKNILNLSEKRAQLKEQLDPKMAQFNQLTQRLEEILQNPSSANASEKKAIEKQLEALNKELKPILQESANLARSLEKQQLELDKFIGLKPMGFFEKLWKKPPKVLNDTVIMTALGMPMTLAYEYFYYNYQVEGIKLPLFSPEMAQIVGLFTFTGIFGNVLYKAIIHTTQDRKRLYQLGEKDQLLAENSREFLANLKGAKNAFNYADDPEIKKLGQALENYYTTFAIPLVGDNAAEAQTQKRLSREEKIAFSIEETKRIAPWVQQAKESYLEASASKEEKKARQRYWKLVRLFQKVLDQIAYTQISHANFLLDLVSERYEKHKGDFEKYIPEEQRRVFQDARTKTVGFMAQLVNKYPYGELRAEPLLKDVGSDFETLNTLFKAGISKDLDNLKQLALTPEFQKMPKEYQAQYKQTLKKLEKGFHKNLFILHAKNKAEAKQDLAALASQEKYTLPLDVQFRYEQAKNTGGALPYLQASAEVLTHDVKNAVKNLPLVGKLIGERAAHQGKYNPWLTGLAYVPLLSMLNPVNRLGMFSILDSGMLAKPIDELARFFFKVWTTQNIPIRVIGFFQEKVLVLRHLQQDQKLEILHQLEKGGPKFYLENRIREAKEKQEDTKSKSK